MHNTYSVVMFAYNEQENIKVSIDSILSNVDDGLDELVVLANGCTDNTADVVKSIVKDTPKIKLVELTIGDKCNAWNYYVHELAGPADVHFFVDADVYFTTNAFPKMCHSLKHHQSANAIAGLPFSGRNQSEYLNMVTQYNCLFGNCYGLSKQFISLIKMKKFKLPIGLSWIDSAITKVVNRDIEDINNVKKDRVIYDPECGYKFDSLSFFSSAHWQLYKNRRARYRLGQLQEKYLEKIGFLDWPSNLLEINARIEEDILQSNKVFRLFDHYFVLPRIQKFAEKLTQQD